MVHEDLLGDQAQYSLSFGYVQALCRVAESAKEAVQVLGQAQYHLFIHGLHLQVAVFGLQRLLTFAQLGKAAAEFLDLDQALLVRIKHLVDAVADPTLGAFHGFLSADRRRGVGHVSQTPVYLAANQRRLFQQADHVVPHNRIQIVLADGATVANRSVRVAPMV